MKRLYNGNSRVFVLEIYVPLQPSERMQTIVYFIDLQRDKKGIKYEKENRILFGVS